MDLGIYYFILSLLFAPVLSVGDDGLQPFAASFDTLCPWYHFERRDKNYTLSAVCNYNVTQYRASKLVLNDCFANWDGSLVSTYSSPLGAPTEPGRFDLGCPVCGLYTGLGDDVRDDKYYVMLTCTCRTEGNQLQNTNIMFRHGVNVTDGFLNCFGEVGKELSEEERKSVFGLPFGTSTATRTVTQKPKVTEVTKTVDVTVTSTLRHLFTITSPSEEPGVITAGLETSTVVRASFGTVRTGTGTKHRPATPTAASEGSGEDGDGDGNDDEHEGEDGTQDEGGDQDQDQEDQGEDEDDAGDQDEGDNSTSQTATQESTSTTFATSASTSTTTSEAGHEDATPSPSSTASGDPSSSSSSDGEAKTTPRQPIPVLRPAPLAPPL